MLASASIKRF